MNFTSPPPPRKSRQGATLIEAVIAVGVLAVAVPLIFATLAQSGESSLDAGAETRCSWVIPACVEELRAASYNQSQLLGEIPAGKEFSDISLAFSESGKALSKLDPAVYAQGIRDKRVRYIVSMTATLPEQENSTTSSATPIRQLRLRLEYPAAAPSGSRNKIDFYTRLP
ncbi:hypothetical protein JIN85_03085 [Luteolibacter pohnpeiensis]|uniref:Uncharacterized protein n=1 Tax=Luteolibacter pohnpeiensis TaxID=454153 RepID=A0A934S3T2_9BACT|nr:hypothetical protein [Luteolibacter pohnpeiensis]MBK1881383.1 hypothetical protein [Luteolibacter pohnpeiensis]